MSSVHLVTHVPGLNRQKTSEPTSIFLDKVLEPSVFVIADALPASRLQPLTGALNACEVENEF
jgi:hypothetical protein